MNRIKWLKIVTLSLFILILWQALTGLGSDFVPQKIFELVHPAGGFLLVIFVVIHVFLNWGWIKSVYFKKVASK